MVIDTIRYDGLKYIDAYNADIVNDITVGNLSTFSGAMTIDANSGIDVGISIANSGAGLATLSIDSGYIKANTTETLFQPQGNHLNVSGADAGNVKLEIENTGAGERQLVMGSGTLTTDTTNSEWDLAAVKLSVDSNITGNVGITVKNSHASGNPTLNLDNGTNTAAVMLNSSDVLNIWSDAGPVAQSSGGALSTFNLELGAGNGTFNKSFLKAQTLTESGGNYATGKVVLNEAGADMDFEVIVNGTGTLPAAFKVDSNNNLTLGSVIVDTEFRLKADTTSNITGQMPDVATGGIAYSTTANAPVAFDGAAWNTMGSSGTYVFYKDVQVTTLDYLNVSGDSGNTIQDYIMPYNGFVVGHGVKIENAMAGGDVMNSQVVHNGTPSALGAVSINTPDSTGFSPLQIGLLPFTAGDRIGAAVDVVIGTTLPGKVSTNVVVLFVIPA